MKIQNLRKFTVQIRQIGTDTIVGTGFVVSDSGEIVTCIHVVEEASETGEAKEREEVGIYFPQARNREDKPHKATVKDCFQDYDDDVAILQLDQEFLPDGVEKAFLGTADKSANNRFKSFGYRRLADYQNLIRLYIYLDNFTLAIEAIKKSLTFARRTHNRQRECVCLVLQGWVAHLRGDIETATEDFDSAEKLEKKINQDRLYLYSLSGIQHAKHLRRTGDADYARKVMEANLKICERNHWLARISQCHHVLGNLDADADNHDSAQSHYQEALKIARSITRQEVLIEALLAQGSWLAKRGEVAAARRDLDEALNYAVAGGYRIYEADIRVGLAWAHLAAGNPSAAQKEAEKAKRMSEEMGYHWGQVDAKEVLEKLE